MVKLKTLVIGLLWALSLVAVGAWAQLANDGGVMDPQTGKIVKYGAVLFTDARRRR